jgi:hypothetical protein
MMNFRLIKDGVVELLASSAGTPPRYTVVGHRRGYAADELTRNRRTVEVYYSNGSFPKSSSSLSGPYRHDVEFSVTLMVCQSAEGNLAALNAQDSRDIVKALAGYQTAVQLADTRLDEFIDMIFNVLMAADSIDLGMDRTLSSRWIAQIRKNQPTNQGEYVILTATMNLTVSVEEEVTGEIGVPADENEEGQDGTAGDANPVGVNVIFAQFNGRKPITV